MKQEELQKLQPMVFDRFERILAQGKLGHAYLFSGDFASFEMAVFLSQACFCPELQEGGLPCGHCRNCRLIEQEEFSDVTIVRPSGNLIKTDMVRELVKDFSQSGFESTKQVFIICDADKMHVNAANSLLKVIEEPQSDICVILLTSHEEAILPTIKSRTQIVQFPKNTQNLINLLEKEGVLKSQARLIAALAGNYKEALELAKNKPFQDLMVLIPKFVAALMQAPNQAYLMISQIVSLAGDKAEQEKVLDLLTLVLAEDQTKSQIRDYLTALIQVRKMWRSNVSLQNALEYMVLKEN